METKEIDNSCRWTVCPLCHSEDIIFIGGIINNQSLFSSTPIKLKNIPEYWKCNNCQSGFIQNHISEAEARNFYTVNKINKWKTEGFDKVKPDEMLRQIKAMLKPEFKVLDIGCNNGELLDFVKAITHHTYGIEYSGIGRAECLRKGHHVYEALHDIPSNKLFDIIFAFDLVEHLFDFNYYLAQCSARLVRKGRLVILTGNPNSFSAKIAKEHWWYLSFPEHLIFPSQQFFSRLPQYTLERYKTIFNSISYQNDYLFRLDKRTPLKIYHLFKSVFLHSYNGFPALDNDHALIILGKK